MRKLQVTLSFLLLTVATNIFAQNTYPWPSSGNIGIGTTTPGSKLSLLTTNYEDGLLISHDGSGYGGIVGFANLHGPSLLNGSYNPIVAPGDAGIVYGPTNGAVPPVFGFVITPWSASTTGLRIDGNGNVSIGTRNSQGYQLAVNGQAIFTRAVVKLQQNWPDYVFGEGYRLPTLDSVARYIRENKHLADVPSSEAIARNGIDLGAQQTVLLRKIEELTLYVIDQQKIIEQKSRETQQLTERLERLEKTMIQLTTKP